MNTPRRKITNHPFFSAVIGFPKLFERVFIIGVIGTLLLSVVNALDGITMSDFAVFALFFASIILFFIYRSGRHDVASFGFLIAIDVLIITNIAMDGGIHDPAMIFFPVLITLAGILFGKWIVPWLTGLIGLETIGVFWLSMTGILQPLNGMISLQYHHVVTVTALILVSGVLIWLMINAIEKNLQKLEDSRQALLDSYNHTLDGWGRALELFDQETNGHSLRVTALTMKFAEVLGLDAETITHIRQGSLLHDIGKIGIPDVVLQKKGHLTREERQIIDQHPVFAYELLKDIPQLAPALDIPYYHHERWDGSGYPLGLQGEEIPLAARIFSIVDNFDALTTERPYRVALTEQAASSYILGEKGGKFDPALVDVFLEKILAIQSIESVENSIMAG